MQEIHIWFPCVKEFKGKESELKKILAKNPGNGSVFIFFRDSGEYMGLPGCSFNCKKAAKAEKLIRLFGLKNIDIISRISSRKSGTRAGDDDGG